MMKIRRILCLILCLAMTAAPAAVFGAEKEMPEIRVLLQRWGLTDRLDVRTQETYLVRGGNGTELLLPQKAEAVFLLRAGKIILFYQGLSVSLGNRAELLHRGDGKESGFRTGAKSELYTGDLALTIQDGALRGMLRIGLEDYVRGVIPWEMGEGFPEEALKAQAVCARTYALSRMDSKKSYDVTDTTNDQVYRGVPETHEKTDRAVRETAGLVITAGGKLAQGYYSASNGGQTELPTNIWGGRDAAKCYAVTEDPWDAENPESPRRTALIRADGTEIYDALYALIRDAFQKQMEGFLPEHFRIDRIENIELAKPRYAAPSRLMTVMRITAAVSGKQMVTDTPAPEEGLIWDSDEGGTPSPTPRETPAPTPHLSGWTEAGTLTAEIPLFPDAVRAMGLSISGADNEIITVEKTPEGFRLQSGRYGHGAGMSQRGAQQMASAGKKTWREIIAFYFPGSSIGQVGTALPAAVTPDPVLAETPGPAASPTPRPTLMPVSGEALEGALYLAEVEHIEDDSSLNLRAEPSTGAEILMRLYRHQRLAVLNDHEVPGWAKVRTDSIEGYVMTSFLEKVNEKSE